MRWPLALLVVGGCGDNLMADGATLSAAPDLTIVAHQDDDLLFMQPDLIELAEARGGLTNVYVTAGNGSGGTERADGRYRGLREAYAEAAGVESVWACGWIDLAGHVAQHCRLDEANISLVFLGYPDGGIEGQLDRSLLRLWSGAIDGADSVAERSTRYDQAELIATVAEVIRQTRPATIRTLDFGATHGRDHSDHMLAGAITLLGAGEAAFTGQLRSFRGYATEGEPETLIEPLYARSENILAHYTACVSDCAPHTCGSACDVIPPEHETWLHRRYALGLRRDVRGTLRTDGGCVRADASVAATCGELDIAELSPAGLLRVGDRCLAALPSGEVSADASCAASAHARWFLDDDGRVWNGAPPPPESVAPSRHLACLSASGDRLRVAPCGDGLAPRWELVGTASVIDRPAFLPSTGRAIRGFGDRVYAIAGGELWSATWTGTSFAAPADEGLLPVEPESLAVGMLDGSPRACGRDAEGILCRALDVPGPAAERWTPAFARTGAATAGDRSLAVAGDEICGLGDEGVMCAPRGLTVVPGVRSRWPSVDGALWAGDLDGDQRPDWCTATASGVACGRDLDRPLTTDGVPWSYALGGVVEPAPGSTALGVLHDLDADGRQDLCALRDGTVWCAHSQGVALGPQVSLGAFPQAAPTALFFVADRACVDDGATLACLPVPWPARRVDP